MLLYLVGEGDSPVMPSASSMRDSSAGMLAASRKSGRASGVEAALRCARLWGRLKTGCAVPAAGTAQECARAITAQRAASQTESLSAYFIWHDFTHTSGYAMLSTLGLHGLQKTESSVWF